MFRAVTGRDALLKPRRRYVLDTSAPPGGFKSVCGNPRRGIGPSLLPLYNGGTDRNA